MAKKSKREEIIRASMSLFNTRGYSCIGINDILEDTGIPKGSFYYYFSSKEDLIQQSIMYYMTEVVNWTNMFPADTMGLRDFFRSQFDIVLKSDYQDVCPIGGIASELAGHDEHFRDELRLVERHVHDFVKKSLMNSLGFNDRRAYEYAVFILMSFQGAVIKAKLEHDELPIKLFDKFIFDMLIRHETMKSKKVDKPPILVR